MKRLFLSLWVAVLGAAAAIAPAVAQGTGAAAPPAASLPPPEAFYAQPNIESAKLSPSGRWLAIATGIGFERVGLAVFDLKEWKAHARVAYFADADIDEFHWVGDDRLVFNVTDNTRGSGEQRWWPGLWVVERDGTGLRQLVKLNREWMTTGSNILREPLDYNHTLLGVPKDDSGEVIIAQHVFDGAGEFQQLLAKRLNVKTGRTRSLSLGVPENVWHWLFDPRGEPRAVVTRSRGRATLHWRAPGAEGWRPVAEYDPLRAPFLARYVDGAGALYVTTVDGPGGVAVLKRFDLERGRPEAEALVSAPGFDFDGELIVDNPTKPALGVRLTTDAETTVWFDRGMAAAQQEADKRWPDRIHRLHCSRCGSDDMVTLAFSFSDADPGQYWVHQRATGEWRKVGNRRNAIVPQQMAATSFERVRARDGVEIPVWVTTPRGPAQGPRPAVLLVHGGPWIRGRSWQWNENAQFLASRGYVVIEPEFRGSTGYGPRLYRAGWKQWGQAMQDDLVDALNFTVAKGWVDGKRVCIAGASYGGYATLMGLARHGEHFRCGVAWVGVTDPRLMFKWNYGYNMHTEYREHDLPRLIGDPVADRAMLDANTPVLLADRIKAPVLLAYGSDDRRVPLVHGTRMRDALAAAGRPPEWVLYPGEGHGWQKLETRVDFARRMEAFLARHLQP
jgi:dipeptidyl aminopeptidase/acylaminoacyl peptidase